MEEDGVRILVDRLWPRGISKEEAKLDDWLKEIGPSTELRQWFNHESTKFEPFKKRYKRELQSGENKETLDKLKTIVKNSDQQITLLFAANNETENQAVVLKEILSNQ